MNGKNLSKAIIVDVDGTLALRSERGPYEWEKLASDVPNHSIAELVTRLVQSGLSLVLVTGREERYRASTLSWLEQLFPFHYELYCRRDNDYRSDVEVKREIFEARIKDKFSIVAVFDDRTRVVQMWREEIGLTCLQVADGNF
jgi:hypothetical protein